MSKSKSPAADNRPRIEQFTAKIHQIEPLLPETGEWQLCDVADPNDQSINSLIMQLRHEGHIRRTGRKSVGDGVRGCYRWHEPSRQAFLDYLDDLTKLPCGHRVHIPDTRGVDGDDWPCKFCGERHPKEVYENRL